MVGAERGVEDVPLSNGALRIRGAKVCAGPGPQPLDPALLGGGDNHVERHVPSPRSGSGAAREPGAARSVATMQLVPAAALLARVDRARSQRDALPDVEQDPDARPRQ